MNVYNIDSRPQRIASFLNDLLVNTIVQFWFDFTDIFAEQSFSKKCRDAVCLSFKPQILNLAYVALFGILMKEILNYVWKNVYAGLRPRDPAPGCSLGINSNENRTELKWCSLIGCIGGV